MISKTLFFNRGIYKSTLRRYLWGSVLYFILLFMITGMSILLNYDSAQMYLPSIGSGVSLIMRNEYILIPTLLAIVVPTVVGLMIFRFIHSKKTSIFVHSLPVKRETNYISTVIAAFTLMGIPVILNALVLMIISLSGYSQLFGIGDCITWMLFNLFALFIMFSCVCFVASVTGNSFAMIVLNVLFHLFVPLLVAGFEVVSKVFLHGFANNSLLMTKVTDANFPVTLMETASSWAFRAQEAFHIPKTALFLVAAVILYILAGFLYKKRRMETAEEVAGFKCLNPIFKYLITFMGAIAAFSIFSYSISDSSLAFWCIIAIVSAVIYFGSEMLLRKSLRVWHTYKGYLGFAIAFAAMICIFAFTSFFGFESRIPEKEDISKVAFYNYYHGETPYTGNDEIIAKMQKFHAKMTEREETVNKYDSDTYIHFEYILKNGNKLHRRYGVSNDELHEIMNEMYQNREYKQRSERVFNEMKSIYTMNIYGNEHVEIKDDAKKEELLECIKEDMLNLNYNEIHNSGWNISVEIEYASKKIDNSNRYNYRIETNQRGERERIYINYIRVDINANFENTLAWLIENGYWEKFSIKNDGIMYICRDYTELPFVRGNEFTGEISEEKEKNIIKLDTPEELEKIINYAHFEKQEYIKEQERYEVYQVFNTSSLDYRNITALSKKELIRLFPDKF